MVSQKRLQKDKKIISVNTESYSNQLIMGKTLIKVVLMLILSELV